MLASASVENPWKKLPQGLRKAITLGAKATLTVGAFYLLLNHQIEDGDQKITIWRAIRSNVGQIDPNVFVPFVLLATGLKMVGIVCSMLRWHMLLIGQGIRFNFWHVVGSFLIGRFLGTFLPSTVGLDGYKLYDATRFSKKVVEPLAATAVEKVMGLSGVFLTFLVTLPLGYQILGDSADTVVLITVPAALAVVVGLFSLLFWPGLVQWGLRLVPKFGRAKIEDFVSRASDAAAAYRGKGKLLALVAVLSFFVHFNTAAMYYFTALAVGAQNAQFWEVCFASSIQIFATVMSPFTIAGEGIREAVQALLLAKRIGASQSVLSAALGFWAAEALTLVGAFFWWSRRKNYQPKLCEITTASESHPRPEDSQAA